MRNYLMIFALFLLASCGTERVVEKIVTPDVPPALLQPVVVEPREIKTIGNLGELVADHVQALDQANGQIIAISEILTCAKTGAQPC